MSFARFALLFSGLVTLAHGLACATGAKQHDYPSAERLTEIARAPVPEFTDSLPPEVEQLQLKGDLPTLAAGEQLRASSTPWHAWLVNTADRSIFNLTENAHCVSQQTAIFLAEHEGIFPGMRARRFINERCGQIDGQVATYSSGWDADTKERSDEELFEQAKEGLAASLAQKAPKGTAVGLSFARHEDRAVFVVTIAVPRVAIETFPMRTKDNKVTIEGTVLAPFIQVSAAVTQGEYGADDCAFDPAVALPKFKMTCEVIPDDATARITMHGAQDGDFFSNQVFSAIVLPSDDDGRVYNQKTVQVDPKLDAQSPRAFLAAVNLLRGQANVPPVTLAPMQSATARGLAPHAAAGQREEDQRSLYNEIFRGMLAGWDLEEGFMIENADAFVEVIGVGANGLRAVDLASTAMESPSSRMALMKKGTKQMAIGINVADEGKALSGLVGLYDPFLEGDYDAASQQAVIARVNRIRKARGLSPHVLYAPYQKAAERAVRRAKGGTSVDSALRGMLNEASTASMVAIEGNWSMAQEADDILIPSNLVVGPARRMGIAVDFIRVEGTRWGKTAAFFVTDQAQSGMVAKKEMPNPPVFATRR